LLGRPELLDRRPPARGRPGGSAVTRHDRACDFLAGLLAGGPRTSREVWAVAREQGLSERTVERELEVRSVVAGWGARRLSYWLLPTQALPETVPPADTPPDLEPWLAPLREQFPPATPLDEM
jgi:hypothetical protein